MRERSVSMLDALDQALGTPNINFRFLHKILRVLVIEMGYNEIEIDLETPETDRHKKSKISSPAESVQHISVDTIDVQLNESARSSIEDGMVTLQVSEAETSSISQPTGEEFTITESQEMPRIDESTDTVNETADRISSVTTPALSKITASSTNSSLRSIVYELQRQSLHIQCASNADIGEKLAPLQDELNAQKASLQSIIDELQAAKQSFDGRFDTIEDKTSTYEDCLIILTHKVDQGTFEKLVASQQQLDEEVCNMQKQLKSVLDANAVTMDKLEEIDENSRSFFSKVNRLKEDTVNLSEKIEFFRNSYETQVRWNHDMQQTVGALSADKATTADMVTALALKGDVSELELKASIESMENLRAEQIALLQEFSAYANERLETLEASVGTNAKATDERICCMNDDIRARIAYLKQQILHVKKHMACEALASTTMYLKDRACLTCKADACVRTELGYPMVAKLKPLQTRNKLTLRPLLDSISDPAPFVHRYSGGQHTVTNHDTKIFYKGNFLDEHPGTASPIVGATLKAAANGNIYVVDNCTAPTWICLQLYG